MHPHNCDMKLDTVAASLPGKASARALSNSGIDVGDAQHGGGL
jgi:hypothetical protein